MALTNFFKKPFIKNVVTLIKGSALSQLILYLIIPILTRLFSEEAFGIYMLFLSSTFLLKSLFSLQFELAIVIPKTNDAAANILVFSIILLLALSSLFFVTILIFEESIIRFLKLESLSYFIYLLPLSIFLSGCITTLEYWNNRKGLFKHISNGLITKSSVVGATQLGIGISSFKNLGLIPGVLLGQFFQLVFLIKVTYNSIKDLLFRVNYKDMKKTIKRFKDIPIFNTLISFSNNLSNELPILLISSYFGLTATGIYGLALKVSKAPIGIIQQSISQVFFSSASKHYNNNQDLKKLVLKTIKNLVVIALIVFLPLFILSFFFDTIFGEDWSQVGIYTRILIPWLFFMFISSPISSITVILNKQKTILLYDILLLAFRFLSFYIGYTFFHSILVSLILFSAVGVIFNIFIILFFIRLTNKKSIGYQ